MSNVKEKKITFMTFYWNYKSIIKNNTLIQKMKVLLKILYQLILLSIGSNQFKSRIKIQQKKF